MRRARSTSPIASRLNTELQAGDLVPGSVMVSPPSSLDPVEPDVKKRVHRGGSFLCTDQFCARNMVGTRGKGEISTGTNHLGFRCVKTL